METDRETLKIRKIQELLGRHLVEGLETVYFPFEELLREPAFKDINAIKTTLNLIQQGSGGRITWEVRLKDRFLPAPTGAAITEYVPPIPLSPVPVGIDVHVSDPSKLDTYFDTVLNKSIAPDSKVRKLVEKDERGQYLYNGLVIEIGLDTIACKILDILLFHAAHDGFLSYEEIERYLVEEKKETPSEDERKRNVRILNAITNDQQGLFHSAKIGGKKLPNNTLKGESLITTVRGKGLKLNNPVL